MNNQTHEVYFRAFSIVFFGILLFLSTTLTILGSDGSNTTRNPVADFDGDGRSDISVFRRSNAFWYVMKSSGGFSAVQLGSGSPRLDTLVPGDYDGDGKTDYAVIRSDSNSVFFDWDILRISDQTFQSTKFGFKEAFNVNYPTPADYDGDGKTDLAIYTLFSETYELQYFRILQSSNGINVDKQWGLTTDKVPPPADYDGDGKIDLAVIRYALNSSTLEGIWYILQSSDGNMRVERFGSSSDKLVPADYDGDGKADIAVWRPENGFWYYIKSSNAAFTSVQFGAADDKPVPADYDGDGKTDIAVFRPSNGFWYLLKSTEGFSAQQFGFGDDVPIPNVYVR